MNHKLVKIEWLDSKGITNQWEYWDEIQSMPPSQCWSVGFLIEETDHHLTIAQGVSETQVMGRTTIPRRSVTSFSYLVSE